MSQISKILCVLSVILMMGVTVHADSQNTYKLLLDQYRLSTSNYNLWSGVEVGAFVAANWYDLDYSEPGSPPGYDRSPSIDGYTGGLLLGYNHQSANMVYGIEADLGMVQLSEDIDGNSANNYSAFEVDWNAHIRAKIGKAINSTMLYIAGGVAIAGVNLSDNDPGWGEDDATHVGWTAGIGAEYAMNNELRVRLEYLYDDYGDETYSISGPYTYYSNIDLSAAIVRVCLSLQF
ncbi:MAG: outer membrane protein [Desulfatirhabdiaceae bacterium]